MRTLIASDQDAFTTVIRQILVEEGQEISVVPLDQAANSLAQIQPDLIILVLSPSPEFALSRLGELRVISKARIFAVGPSMDSRMVLRALRSGADDYVEEAELDGELRAAFSRLKSQIAAPTEVGKLIAFLSPSGGGGSSTLAVNVAVTLAREGKSVGMIDMKMAGADLATLLNLKPAYTLADLCQNVTRMDRVMFERSLVRHESGVQLLGGPRSPVEIKHVTTDGVRQAMIMSRVLLPFTILDVDHTFAEEQVLVLRQADTIFLVLRLDFTSLRNARRTLDAFKELGIPNDKITVIVNRYGQPKELPAAKAEEVLAMKVLHFVPDDPKTMNQANSNGIPAVVESPSSKVAKTILAIAARLEGR